MLPVYLCRRLPDQSEHRELLQIDPPIRSQFGVEADKKTVHLQLFDSPSSSCQNRQWDGWNCNRFRSLEWEPQILELKIEKYNKLLILHIEQRGFNGRHNCVGHWKVWTITRSLVSLPRLLHRSDSMWGTDYNANPFFFNSKVSRTNIKKSEITGQWRNYWGNLRKICDIIGPKP